MSYSDVALARLASAAPLPANARVLEVGSSALAPHLQRAGATHVLSVSRSAAASGSPSPPHVTLGNAPGVRFLVADVFALPAYQTPFSAAYFISGFEGREAGEALAKAVLLVSHGGHIVIAQPSGGGRLPDEETLRRLISGLPLRLVSFAGEAGLRSALLQVPPLFALPQGAVRLDAPVVTGFGRGSRQLGVPTANMSTSVLGQPLLATLPRGVYYGWARLEGDLAPRKAVLNVGLRPTFEAETPPETTVEVHLLHPFPADFYGARLRVLVLGFIRPEMKFEGGIAQLVARIRQDVGMASSLLDAPANAAAAGDAFLA